MKVYRQGDVSIIIDVDTQKEIEKQTLDGLY